MGERPHYTHYTRIMHKTTFFYAQIDIKIYTKSHRKFIFLIVHSALAGIRRQVLFSP